MSSTESDIIKNIHQASETSREPCIDSVRSGTDERKDFLTSWAFLEKVPSDLERLKMIEFLGCVLGPHAQDTGLTANELSTPVTAAVLAARETVSSSPARRVEAMSPVEFVTQLVRGTIETALVTILGHAILSYVLPQQYSATFLTSGSIGILGGMIWMFCGLSCFCLRLARNDRKGLPRPFKHRFTNQQIWMLGTPLNIMLGVVGSVMYRWTTGNTSGVLGIYHQIFVSFVGSIGFYYIMMVAGPL
ncbi:hypothetical protein C8R43DRAFT_1186686 [Mycena crocata]|nr:hypothetical protein C8R43DRAFT_1186686 [Mycena crocata]